MEMNLKPPSLNRPSKQNGFMTIVVAGVLLSTITTATILISKSVLTEEKISANAYRSTEVFEAADSGGEYALAWLGDNLLSGVVWTPVVGTTLETSSPMVVPNIVGSSYTYNVNVTLQRDVSTANTSNYITISSTATATTDTSITGTITQYARQITLLNPGLGGTPPPLMIDGCLSGVTGNPDIYPTIHTDGTFGTAIASSQGEFAGAGGTECLDEGHLDLNFGSKENDFFTPGTAWETTFDISKAQMKALSDQAIADGLDQSTTPKRRFYWVSDSSNWHTSLGSATDPVYLIFDSSAGCPKINGSPTIYGIIFYEYGASCDSNGWGGAEVYGSVVTSSNVTKYTANAELYDWSLAGGGGSLDIILGAPSIPGTWRDF